MIDTCIGTKAIEAHTKISEKYFYKQAIFESYWQVINDVRTKNHSVSITAQLNSKIPPSAFGEGTFLDKELIKYDSTPED